MIYLLWGLAFAALILFSKYFLLPFLKEKYFYKRMARLVNKMQENPNYSEKTKTLLKELEDEFRNADKDLKL